MTSAIHYQTCGYHQVVSEPVNVPCPDFHSGNEQQTRLLACQESTARLQWHLDARGGLVELYRRSWETGPGNGPPCHGMVRQAYISTTLPGIVKAWHLHARQTDRFVCLRGSVMLAMCDILHRPQDIKTVVLSPGRGCALQTVPPGVAHGWKAIGNNEAWILNLCSHEYDGTDEWRRPAHAGPNNNVSFDWNRAVDG